MLASSTGWGAVVVFARQPVSEGSHIPRDVVVIRCSGVAVLGDPLDQVQFFQPSQPPANRPGRRPAHPRKPLLRCRADLSANLPRKGPHRPVEHEVSSIKPIVVEDGVVDLGEGASCYIISRLLLSVAHDYQLLYVQSQSTRWERRLSAVVIRSEAGASPGVSISSYTECGHEERA